MPTTKRVGISRKISNSKERGRLRQIVEEIKPKDTGLIIRTFGEGKSKKDFVQDLKYLLRTWHQIESYAKRKPALSLIHKEPNISQKIARDIFNPQEDKLTTNDPREYRNLKRFLVSLGIYSPPSLELYKDKVALFSKYDIEKEIEKALNNKVYLKSGGYILIEETEALVSIDVNTGRYTGKEGLEETAFKTNAEASKEIARQLRLRNLGGLIIVDFIDMESSVNRRKLLSTFNNALRGDRARTRVDKITSFGLVEMTRERIGSSLSKVMGESCPCCKGSGRVKSIATIAIQKTREIERVLQGKKERLVKLRFNPKMFAYLKERNKDRVLSRRLWKRVVFQEDEKLNLEEVKCVISGQEITI